MLDYRLNYSSTLKMEATYSSETSVDFQRSTVFTSNLLSLLGDTVTSSAENRA
jgi:hypothetical protein